LEQIIEASDRDHLFTATEALEYGFVDHIIADAEALNLGSSQE